MLMRLGNLASDATGQPLWSGRCSAAVQDQHSAGELTEVAMLELTDAQAAAGSVARASRGLG
jgi:hypothetical protein